MANVYSLIFEIADKTKAGAASINRNLKAVNEQAQKVKSALGGLGSAASSAVGALGKTAAAATAAAGAFAFLAKKNLDSLDALGKTASKLGVSTKFLSEYSLVANQAGLSTDQFQTGLQRFIRRLGQAQQGTGELEKPLAQLGINMKDANGNFREGTDVFQEFITKLGQTTNKSQQLALAMGAFDTEGVAFVNIASMSAKEIANLRHEAELAGTSIDEKLTQSAAEANDKLELLLLRAKGFSLQFFGAMAPAIANLADDIKKALDEAVAGSGGMEAFANRLAGDFLTQSANLLETLSAMFDGFTNSLRMATNVLKQVLVSLSPLIPGASFEFGDAAGMQAKKDAVQEKLNKQNQLIEQQKAKVAELREQYNALPTNMFGGRKDPDNLYGQIVEASRQLGHMGMAASTLQDELDELNSTYVFEKMATDSKAVQEATAGSVQMLRDQAGVLYENAEAAAKANEIAKQYPYNENADAITRLAAQEKLRQETIKETTVVTQAELDRQAALNAHHHQVYARSREEQRLKELAEEQKEYQAKVANANRLYGQMRVLGEQMHAEELSTIEKNKQAYALYYHTRTIQLEDEAKAKIEMEEKTKRAHQQYGETRIIAAQQFADREKEILEKLKQAYQQYGETRMVAHEDELKKREEQQAREMQAYRQYGFLRGRAPKDPVPPKKTTSGAVKDLRSDYEKYRDAIVDASKATVAEEKYLRRMKKTLDDAAISTQGLTAAQVLQLETVNERLSTFNDDTMNVNDRLQDHFSQTIGAVSDAMTDVLLGLGDGFKSLEDLALSSLKMIISTLIEAFIRSQILGQSIGGLSGGGFFGSLLGGLGSLGMGTLVPGLGLLVGAGMLLGRQSGGTVAKDRPYIVGERGPEIFTPQSTGNITSNKELNAMGGQGDLAVNFTINAIDTQTGVEFLLENKRVITGVIQEAYMRRGSSGPLG